jgi:hypothetical protein
VKFADCLYFLHPTSAFPSREFLHTRMCMRTLTVTVRLENVNSLGLLVLSIIGTDQHYVKISEKHNYDVLLIKYLSPYAVDDDVYLHTCSRSPVLLRDPSFIFNIHQ